MFERIALCIHAPCIRRLLLLDRSCSVVVPFRQPTRAGSRNPQPQGIEPPILPKELARLDRVEWVLRRTSVAEVAARMKKEKEAREHESEEGTEQGSRYRRARKLNFESERAWGGDGETQRPKNGGSGGPLPDDNTTEAAVAAVAPSSPSPSTAAAAAALAPSESSAGGTGGDNKDQGVTPSITTTISTGLEEEEDDGEEDDVADRLAGIFEFLRSGNSLLLPPDLRDDWDSRPDLGLGLLSADDHQDDLIRRHHVHSLSSRPATAAGAIDSSRTPPPAEAGKDAVQQARAAAEDNAGGGGGSAGRKGDGLSYNFTASGGSGKGVSTWAGGGLFKEARSGDGERMTYHDLRMALTATAPRGRRSETTNEKLERRLIDRRDRAEQMAAALWGNDRPGLAENLYTRSFELSSSLNEDEDKTPG